MRFIGNKENLLEYLYKIARETEITSGTFCDFFAGTTNVGRFFKQKGYSIISSDLLYFSYVLQRAYIKNNEVPIFKSLIPDIEQKVNRLLASPLDIVVDYLNKIPPVEGFIYKNYTDESTVARKYFLPENGKRIDSVRQTIEKWKQKDLITDDEYFILLACLIESVPYYANISGVYAAFLKTYDPRALKKLAIRPINICQSNNVHHVYNENSVNLAKSLNVDILYIDPPYNARQYGPNYHLLETIAMYDEPAIKGVTGLRDSKDKKSEFCNKLTALSALEYIAGAATYKYLMLSYNSEGIMPSDQIFSVLSKFGKVDIIEIDYRRFKSNSNGEAKHKKIIQEQVYLLKAN